MEFQRNKARLIWLHRNIYGLCKMPIKKYYNIKLLHDNIRWYCLWSVKKLSHIVLTLLPLFTTYEISFWKTSRIELFHLHFISVHHSCCHHKGSFFKTKPHLCPICFARKLINCLQALFLAVSMFKESISQKTMYNGNLIPMPQTVHTDFGC